MHVHVEAGVETYWQRHIVVSKGFFVCEADVSGVAIYIQRAKKNKTSEEKAKWNDFFFYIRVL